MLSKCGVIGPGSACVYCTLTVRRVRSVLFDFCNACCNCALSNVTFFSLGRIGLLC